MTRKTTVYIAGKINGDLKYREKFAEAQRRKEKMNNWICESCTYYPPSSCDGKPCCICDTDEPMLNCYQMKEGVE